MFVWSRQNVEIFQASEFPLGHANLQLRDAYGNHRMLHNKSLISFPFVLLRISVFMHYISLKFDQNITISIHEIELKHIINYIFEMYSRNYSSQADIFRSRQNGSHYTDDMSKCIIVNDNFRGFIQIPQFLPRIPLNDMPALVQIINIRYHLMIKFRTSIH